VLAPKLERDLKLEDFPIVHQPVAVAQVVERSGAVEGAAGPSDARC
jgi:hypothetical protein